MWLQLRLSSCTRWTSNLQSQLFSQKGFKIPAIPIKYAPSLSFTPQSTQFSARKVWKATDWLEGMYTQRLRNATQNEHHKLTCACHWSCHFWLLCMSLLTHILSAVMYATCVLANPRPLYSHTALNDMDILINTVIPNTSLYNHRRNWNEVYIHFIQQPFITAASWTLGFLSELEIFPMYKVNTSREKKFPATFSFFVPPKAHSPHQNSSLILKKDL